MPSKTLPETNQPQYYYFAWAQPPHNLLHKTEVLVQTWLLYEVPTRVTTNLSREEIDGIDCYQALLRIYRVKNSINKPTVMRKN